MIKIFAVALLLITHSAFPGEQEAKAFRTLIESRGPLRANVAEDLRLRTTKGFNQGSSVLCWAFATLNILETNFLERHPEVSPDQIELSRWALGYHGRNTYGTMANALDTYIAKFGLVMDADYALDSGPPPLLTKFLDTTLTPIELSKRVLENLKYSSYGFIGNRTGWHQHPDQDALPGTRAYYLKRSKMRELIITSLKKRLAIYIAREGHGTVIYGATFDSNGEPITYHIKDSGGDYFYEGDAELVHDEIWEVDTYAGFK